MTSIEEHNAEAQAVWDAFNAGKPIRPPVALGTATQFFIYNDAVNPGGAVDWERYCTDADTMLDFQLRAAAWRAEHIAPFCDDPVGMPPNREAWLVRIDLQNFDEAAHLGAPVLFLPGQVPDTPPILAGDRKHSLFDAGLPDPLTGGWYRRAHEMLERWRERLARQPEYLGWPVRIDPFGWWSGGPLTLAVALRGPELMSDLYEDPDYVRTLLDYLTEVTIARVRAHARFFGLPDPPDGLWFADDALQLLSAKMAREFMLPIYRRMKAEMTTAEHAKIHLCGDATRHFRWLKEELGVNDFETGFPVDHGRLRRELEPDVTIHGGPTIMTLRDGSPDEVRAETQRILDSGVCEGGRFVLREANNLAPRTPTANLAAMYETARAWRGTMTDVVFGGSSEFLESRLQPVTPISDDNRLRPQVQSGGLGASSDWYDLPTPRPDFNNLLAVLRREVPARPTLFEFFLNDRLHDQLAPPATIPDGPYRRERQVLQAYYRAGYDFTNVRVPGFDFPTGRDVTGRTVSLNAGGLIVDWPSYEAYPWPDVEAADFGVFDALAAVLPGGMKLIAYGPGGVLENVIEIVGFERLCLLLVDDPDLVECVFEAVGETLVRYYEIAAAHPAVGACIDNDDWGFKTQTMLSLRQLRQYVFPWHKRIVAAIHAAGKPVILHSCGHFGRILDDMTDIGIDARHSYEDTILPVEDAYERYRDRFAIIGGVDVDFVCRAEPEQVYARARAMLERAAGRGGYALGTGNSVPDYVPDAGYFAMIRAALETR